MEAPAKPVNDPKKIGLLLLLIAAAVVLFMRQSDVGGPPQGGASSGTPGGAVTGSTTGARAGLIKGASGRTKISRLSAAEKGSESFKPAIRPWPNEGPDERFDPALRTDLLARLSDVRLTNVGRNVFEFYVPAPPANKNPSVEPTAIAPVLVTAPPPPPPAPILLKFYGHTLPAGGGATRVFCVLNDQVMVASEGTVLQHRYKIQSISPTSVVVEDLQDHHKQTIPVDSQDKAKPTP